MTRPVKLPGLSPVATGNPALDTLLRQMIERMDVREGSRGDPMERVVTHREMKALGLDAGQIGSAGLSSSVVGGSRGGVMVQTPGGSFTRVPYDTFADELRKTALYRDLMSSINSVNRFDGVPAEVRALLLSALAEEAAQWGAEIRRIDRKVQSATENMAFTVESMTATVSGLAVGVHEASFASANEAVIRASADAAEVSARVEAVTTETIARNAQVQDAAYAALEATLAANNINADVRGDVALAKLEIKQDVVDGISAEASQRLLLAAKLDTDIGTTLAAVTNEATARSTGDAAEATARQTLSSQLLGPDGTSLTAGLIYTDRVARATQDGALAQQITLLSAGAGEQFDWKSIWYFDAGVESWTGNGTPTASAGFLRPANQASGAYVESPAGIGSDGAKYNQLRLRIRKVGAPVWAGFLWWRAVADAAWDAGRRVSMTAPDWDPVTGIGLVTVNPAWAVTIDRIRLDLSSAQSATDYFELDWVAVGRPSPGASSAQLLTEETARTTADTAITSSVTTLSAQVNNATTGLPAAYTLIAAEQTARATADTAEATARGVLAARVTTAEGVGAANAGAILTEQTVRADADGVITGNLNALSATVTGPSGVLETQASLVAEQEVQAGKTNALSRDTRTLLSQSKEMDEATLRTVLSGEATRVSLMGSLALAKQELKTDIVDGLSAEAAARLDLGAVVGANAAVLASEQLARSSADTALSSSITTLAAIVETVDTTLTAAILEEATARADALTAEATARTLLQTTVNGNTAALSVEATTRATQTGDLFSKYTVKVNAGGAVAGYGIAASENAAGVGTSAFVVQADKFAVTTPYTYSTEATPVTPTPTVGQTWYKPSTSTSYIYIGGVWTVFTPKIPFGIDTTNGTIYIDGQVRINAGGPTILDGIQGPAGSPGSPGGDGERGSIAAFGSQFGISSAGWDSGQAQATIYNALYGTSLSTLTSTWHLRIGDQVTLSNGSSFAEMRYYGGYSATDTDADRLGWLKPGVVIDGNLLVSGTVSASKISGGTVTATVNFNTSGYGIFSGTSPTYSIPSIGLNVKTSVYGVATDSIADLGYRCGVIGRASNSADSTYGVGVAGVASAGTELSTQIGVWGAGPVGGRFDGTSEAIIANGPVRITGQITSTVAAGTAPISVVSTTKCTNLNADLLDGLEATDFYRSTNPNGYVGTAALASYATVASLSGYATSGHNHDATYAAAGHTHSQYVTSATGDSGTTATPVSGNLIFTCTVPGVRVRVTGNSVVIEPTP